jgi:hypothetical protein
MNAKIAHRPLFATLCTLAATGAFSNAATLLGSYENIQVTGFDLSAQGYNDWARWETTETASLEMAGGSIINSTLTGLTAGGTTFTANHAFTQFATNTSSAYARSGSGASMTVTLNLTAGVDYSIELFSRAVNAGENRNDVEMLASYGLVTDTIVVPKNLANVNGMFVYSLDVTDVTTSGPLTIKLTSVNQGAGTPYTVRLGAVGVTAIPEPSAALLGGLGLLALLRRRR